MRIFIAVDLTEDIKDKIIKFVEQLKRLDSNFKWIQKQNLHLTLKFIGEISQDKILDVQEKIKESLEGKKSFKILIKSIGCFPSISNPRIIWLGISKEIEFENRNAKDELELIAKTIDKNLGLIGINKEKREFHSHLTIARVKMGHNIQKLKDTLKEYSEIEFGTILVKEIVLYESKLTPKGAVYSKLKIFNI